MAVYVYLGQDAEMELTNVPDETGVGPLGVAPQLAGRNSSKHGVDWTSGIGSRRALINIPIYWLVLPRPNSRCF